MLLSSLCCIFLMSVWENIMCMIPCETGVNGQEIHAASPPPPTQKVTFHLQANPSKFQFLDPALCIVVGLCIVHTIDQAWYTTN